MSIALEQECAALRARVAELEARLAERSSAGSHRDRPEDPPSEQGAEARLLRAALHSLADAVLICDGEGRLLHFNAAASAIFGEASRDVPPSEWSARYGVFFPDGVTPVPPSHMPLYRAVQGESTDGVEMFVRSERVPAGTYVECSARCIRDTDGAICGAVVVCRDLGERRRYEAEREKRARAEQEQLAAEKERHRMARIFESLLENLDIVVWSTDEKGVFTFHDGRGCEAAGLSRGALLGQNALEVFPDERLVRAALVGVTGHDRVEAYGVVWEHWVLPLTGENKAIEGVIGMSQNVTEAHQAKAELEAKLAVIQRQQEVIFNLETPIIQVWDHVLTLPMVGVVDSKRAARLTDDLLSRVTQTQARFAILDLTGVDVVDTGTAGHMLNIIAAVRLLGAEGIITGIRPNVAQTMISLGLDLTRVRTLATLRDGLSFAIRKLPADGGSARRGQPGATRNSEIE